MMPPPANLAAVLVAGALAAAPAAPASAATGVGAAGVPRSVAAKSSAKTVKKASAVKYGTSYSCRNDSGHVWLKVWSGKPAKNGTWRLYAWMSGHAVYRWMGTHEWVPWNLNIAGKYVRVAGVQSWVIKKGYVANVVANWKYYFYDPEWPYRQDKGFVYCTSPMLTHK